MRVKTADHPGDDDSPGAAEPVYRAPRLCDDRHGTLPRGGKPAQATSGFKPSGHRHDFEHVEVVWRKNGNDWTRGRLLLSAHGGHRVVAWRDAESWNNDRGHAARGLEHPRIFVGYGSHSMYNNQGGRKDVISAYTDEYRHADYPV
ncbi:hypothetical protein ACH492_11250 [Streptomyces sp. NPDC019443]|uniref:hypothetical protein n=1 Tax=Streptomyces sp. NPDC019443 TaxID=3365061 RepID=UPI0037B1A690